MMDIDYSSDSDDSNDTAHRIYSGQGLRSKNSISRTPRASVKKLNACAISILDEISEVNNRFHTKEDKHYDCVAVGYTTNHELIVGGNVKERFPHPTTGPKKDEITYGEFGFSDRLIEPITKALNGQLNKNGDFKIHIIQQDPNEVQTPATNARDHAEMQIIAYAEQHGMEIEKIGISKPACVKCEKQLESHDVAFENDKSGNGNPQNWAEPEEVKVQNLRSIKRNKLRVKFDARHHNIPKTKREAGNIMKNHVKQQVIPKPICTVTTASVLDIIEDIDKDPYAHAGTFNAYAGKYKKPRTRRIGVCAGASVAETSASASIFGASASLLSVSAHAEIGVNLSAGANATVARAEAHAGPVQVGVGLNFNTSVSAGVDGLHASFLGFGFDLGPKLSIQTPVADASCTLS